MDILGQVSQWVSSQMLFKIICLMKIACYFFDKLKNEMQGIL